MWWCLQKYTLIRYAHDMRPRIEVSDSVQSARDAIDGMVLELTEPDLQLWFTANPKPSPTALALAFGIDPGNLKQAAADSELVRLALYQIIAVAEAQMFDKVYGPKAVIQRCELFLPIETVSDGDFSDMFEKDAG